MGNKFICQNAFPFPDTENVQLPPPVEVAAETQDNNDVRKAPQIEAEQGQHDEGTAHKLFVCFDNFCKCVC
jgi:hypothetical protein